MTLEEDFFTLNKLENGLITPDGVNELITVMQRVKDLVVDSFGQTTRQWSKVAKIIAATENKDCLDHFIQLNGLIFIGKWIKDANKLKHDDESSFLEDLIISLLKALEKLQTDDKRLFSSGIMKTVQDLIADNNHAVREKAKELCDNWMLIQDKSNIPHEAKNNGNGESRPPDTSMDSETKNQEPLDCVEPSSKSRGDDGNEESSSKSGVGKSDVKNENEINFGDKTDLLEVSTLSSPSEQIAMVAEIDNSLESCIKTDVLTDKDDGMAYDDEGHKMSSNSDRDKDDNEFGVESNRNSENETCFLKLTINNKKSDRELVYGMIDPLDIARQVAIEVEREVDSRERSCSTSDSKNCQEIQNQRQSQNQNLPAGGSDKEVSPEPVKDAETLVSQISEVAQESELDTGRLFSGFDLNQEVCSEGPDAHNLNQQSGFHDFDLNVAGGGQEDNIVIIPGLPSGEESSVANPRKPERLQWDLNSIGDDQIGRQSLYHASSSSSSLSSSSSSKQPILRNIDLNLKYHPNGEDAVISIFGARVEVNRNNDHKPQLEKKIDFNFGKSPDSSTRYGHHNGMFFSIPIYASSSSSSSYGMPMPVPTPMPYMVDSRGTPFVPQMIGSQPSPPFLMNMAAAGAPSGASGFGPSLPPHHNFDLNTGLMINGGLRQFFPNVDGQASSSSVLGKRHEPDSSWQFFPINKRQQPPWR